MAVWPRRQQRPGLRFHRCALPPDEVTREDRIPVTTPARTLLDLASVLNGPQLERAINEAEIRRLDGVLSLIELVERHPRVQGVGRLREVLSRLDSGARGTRNDFEGAFFTFLRRPRASSPQPNTIIQATERSYEADFDWPGSRLIAELDGRATHGTRRAFENDRARDRALLLAGWRTTRITWRQLHEDPTALAADLTTLLD
jgi:very-short-patch-repair endonuclease